MATNSPFGLRPARHLTGGQIRTKRYTVTASGNVNGIAIGDAVRHNTAGDGIARVSGDVTKLIPILGAVTALYDSNNRPLTHSQPTRGPYLLAAVAGFADVADDPQTVFVIQADATVAAGDFGKFVTISGLTAGGVNTAAGTSTMQAKWSSIDTSVAQLQILGVAKNEDTQFGTSNLEGNLNTVASLNANVEVLIANHIYRGNVGSAIS